MMAEALPTLLMLLPAAQGALTLSLGTYAEYLRDAGVNVPYNLPAALALITTASLAALARYLEHGISGEEYEVRQDRFSFWGYPCGGFRNKACVGQFAAV